ncbi:YycH family regulatory protein [Heyndrickxia sp. NPDC080065]|uniref:YycH family regulatory protein n=1 Tax=Heyndrickxia sp. NPDC080065 TaxID=3390568 RepID=UPI003D03FA58
MKYETLKTVVLVFLVAVSLYLTWTLWTFQVKYETIDNTEIPEKKHVEQKDVKDLIKPMKIVLHEKNRHYGTIQEQEIDLVMNEISNWKFYDIGEVKTYKDNNEIEHIINGSKKLDIEFPDEIPFDTYKGILRMNDRKGSIEDFDRMVIDLSNPSQKVTNVYFINTKNKNEIKVFSGSASYSGLQAFVNKLQNRINLNQPNLYQPYSAFKLSNRKTIFLPTNEPKISRYSYYWDKTDSVIIEKFKTALFPVPNLVEKSQEGSIIEYTDGTSFMRANTDQGTIYFTNPGEGSDVQIHGKDLIKKSNDFVNYYGGWIDNFRYFSKNLKRNQVIFRLYKDGLPVFNPNHLAEVMLNWGETQIYEYARPYMGQDTLLYINSSEVKLSTAEVVIDSLLNDSKIDNEKIDNVLIGYQLKYDPKVKILLFEPTWYYLSDGTWKPLDIKEEQRGLE